MALKAEGAALDCFEVTLKCEEGEDDEEAMVVAVIPRPEPMLRGENGRGIPLPRHGPGLGLPPHTSRGSGYPLPHLQSGAQAPPLHSGLVPGRPLPPSV